MMMTMTVIINIFLIPNQAPSSVLNDVRVPQTLELWAFCNPRNFRRRLVTGPRAHSQCNTDANAVQRNLPPAPAGTTGCAQFKTRSRRQPLLVLRNATSQLPPQHQGSYTHGLFSAGFTPPLCPPPASSWCSGQDPAFLRFAATRQTSPQVNRAACSNDKIHAFNFLIN